jgi:hypothetical protein
MIYSPGSNAYYTPTAAVASYDVIGLPGGGNAQVAVYGSAIAPEPEAAAGVRLNELVVWNTSGVVSANGEYVDWIELYNENDHALDISGWTLTDDDTDPDKYMLPAGTVIGPNGFLLVFASTDTAPPTGELYTGFALDEVNGGYLGLFAPIGGTPTLMSEVEYPAISDASRSYAVLDDESKTVWNWMFGVPTPNLENHTKKVWSFTVYASSHVVINDIPDPRVPYNLHSPIDVSNFVPLSDWLNIVKSETSRILGDQSGQTIVSPMNSASVVIGTGGDLSVSADVQLNLGPLPSANPPIPEPTIANMPNNLGNLTHLYKTMHNVVDGSLVVVGNLDVRPTPQSDAVDVWGYTLLALEKKVIFVAAEAIRPIVRGKWHSKTFVHELAHYAGVKGHPVLGFTEWYDERLIIWNLASPQTNEFEPWFSVVANKPLKNHLEGLVWGTDDQRRRVRPLIPGLDGNSRDDMLDAEIAIAAESPW